MEIVLERIAKRKTYTIGRLYIQTQGGELSTFSLTGRDGESLGNLNYFCDTLEPTWRDYVNGGRRIRDRSAIPEGRYLVLIVWSKEHAQWLPILWGIPMFKDVFIQEGEMSVDTTGGIIVGRNVKVGKVLDSHIWLHRLKHKILEAQQRNEQVWITITQKVKVKQ